MTTTVGMIAMSGTQPPSTSMEAQQIRDQKRHPELRLSVLATTATRHGIPTMVAY